MNESYTDWTLVSLSPLSAVAQIGLCVAVLVAVGFVLWSYRGARRPFGLMLVRVLAGLVVLGFVLEPALQLRVVRRIKNRVGIVVDRSLSMSLEREEGQKRYDAVLAALEADPKGLGALADAHVLDWFDLDGPTSPATLATPPIGEHSDLVTGLERAREAGGGKPLAGLVLISDGADNAELEGESSGQLSPTARERLRRLGVPVNTVYAGSGQGFRDLSVAELRADEFAFVHNTIEIDVMLEAVGMGNTTVPVTLKREGEILASQEVALGEGKPRAVFKHKPDKIGAFVYTVSTPVQAGEAVSTNNERAFVLSVIRDKIRVLQVAGRPSWDERFLRQHLKENPNVDLISFFILRTPTDVPGAPEGELSLIPFPVEKLFTTELKSFDVVVFQNFDYRPYKMRQYLPNIREAVVEAGLGFVMIGGEQSFADGGYQGTELEEIVPLQLESGGVVQRPVKPRLTDAGRTHPVTDLTRGAGRNDLAWQELAGLSSLNRTGALAQAATVLVVEPSIIGAGGAPQPIVAVQDAGQGRTMAIATDTLWRWRFAAGKDGGSSERAYHRFWSNALRWLVRDPEHARVRVTPAKRRFDVGEPADVSFTVLGIDYRPVPQAHLEVTLTPTGAPADSPTPPKPLIEKLTAGEGGLAQRRYEGLAPGAYRVQAFATASGKRLGSGEGVFVVQHRSLELTRGAPRPDLLQAVARLTGGKSQEIGPGLWNELELVDPEVVEVDRRRNVELWDNTWGLLAGVLLLALDWALRRRRGYL